MINASFDSYPGRRKLFSSPLEAIFRLLPVQQYKRTYFFYSKGKSIGGIKKTSIRVICHRSLNGGRRIGEKRSLLWLIDRGLDAFHHLLETMLSQSTSQSCFNLSRYMDRKNNIFFRYLDLKGDLWMERENKE